MKQFSCDQLKIENSTVLYRGQPIAMFDNDDHAKIFMKYSECIEITMLIDMGFNISQKNDRFLVEQDGKIVAEEESALVAWEAALMYFLAFYKNFDISETKPVPFKFRIGPFEISITRKK